MSDKSRCDRAVLRELDEQLTGMSPTQCLRPPSTPHPTPQIHAGKPYPPPQVWQHLEMWPLGVIWLGEVMRTLMTGLMAHKRSHERARSPLALHVNTEKRLCE